MTTYFYGFVTHHDLDVGGKQDIICLSAENMLACLVYANAPEEFTLEDVRQILGDAHFADDFDDDYPFDGAEKFNCEDEYYQYPHTVMLADLPEEMLALGKAEANMVSSWIDISSEKEEELLAVAKAKNLSIIRDDNLAHAVDPYVDLDKRLSRDEFEAAVKRLQSYIAAG
ncbi:hypothetical protein D3875_00955 [Deinococcus cavernae]|uniref:Uncharacterized protein n=1 Tax=Deinococcus cavernae TaxID=2320857 RepID=A0A418VHN2_9DEIO|nr:hypothetical protein [Deinococcus cavernae]RJF75649.1 hypothetical protein D3875_00955 [Deinococcus cavernae]